jgi:hypothetical protein
MGAAVALLFTSAAPRANAEGSDVAAAETLFREGKQRMAARDYVRACPKLADSFKLDPATGTLLALAMCHERAGKLASAWAAYADAAARAKREARPDREKAAREKVAALEPRLSFLTISSSRAVSEIAGLEISRNGAAVGLGTLGTAVPMDGGTYRIAASAPRRKPWSAQITIGASGERHTTYIPALEESAAAPVAEIASPSAKPALELPSPTSSAAAKDASMAAQADTAKSTSGYGALAAATIAGGAVSLAIGTTYMLRAMAKNEESQNGCSADRCSPVATQERLDARAFGNVATVAFLAGGALLAMGTTLYLVGSPASAASTHSAPTARSSASLRATPFVGPGGFGGVLQGTF